MGLLHIMERGGSDYREYKRNLKMAKKAIETLCELTDEMEEEYGERSYSRRDDEMDERSRMRSYR